MIPVDDCLYALQATLSHLTRSSSHSSLQRHGISRLPDVEGDKPARKKLKAYPIRYFHIDIAEVRTEQGKLHEKATTAISASFLRSLIEAVPYKIHTMLADQPFH